MNFFVGQKVKIKNCDLQNICSHGTNSFMNKLKGQTMVIRRIEKMQNAFIIRGTDHKYDIFLNYPNGDKDDSGVWDDNCFEKINNQFSLE